jgi:hypothetical protein
MAHARGVAEPLNVELACAGFPGELATRRGLLETNRYRGPSWVEFQLGPPYSRINE